jgi:site-specific recombinase XerD
LRHSFASRYVINGGNVALLQELLGNKDLATTQRTTSISP